GSKHDKNIREFSINCEGIHIGRPFRDVSGILSGNLTHFRPEEIERVADLFSEEEEVALSTKS
ncbi:MAG: circadian clock protein KaiC, partial [Dehalococcoidia bacterium]